MDRLTFYRDALQHCVSEYERLYRLAPEPGVEVLAIHDPDSDQYLLMRVGWSHEKRIRTTYLHVRLHDGKIWIEEDWTEEGIATDLLRAGVPASDIVLAFHPPELRDLTEFASA